jgi:histidine ammonia-lyase
MSDVLRFEVTKLSIETIKDFIFERKSFQSIEITAETKKRIELSQRNLLALLEKRIPIYGVTTGFGDSSSRFIDASQSEMLQKNLVAYLNCGTGKSIPERATRATLLIRLNSLCQGYSGVSLELIEHMKLFLEKKWTPVTPREGSLGASGDLIPLAYLANALQGNGELHGSKDTVLSTETVFAENKVSPYSFKAKEALAVVNGTSTMAGLAMINLNHAHFLSELATLTTAWMCIALKGRTEAFDTLINEQAKSHLGQTEVAQKIRKLLAAEHYEAEPLTQGPVQDRYSLRCAPQILGPVVDTISQCWDWLETEINSASDNPLIGTDGSLSTGGNFYGGYLAHAMDYLKICMAHQADMLDRQLILLMDERQNRGLPPNLAAWDHLPENERYLHHGLKGLHQSVSAITSEIMAKATPNSIFSRSSENHNQDKVSLGLSSSTQCLDLIDQLFNLQAMVLICLAQALDLRKVNLKGAVSQSLYRKIRKHVPFVTRDQALAKQIANLVEELKNLAVTEGEHLLK